MQRSDSIAASVLEDQSVIRCLESIAQREATHFGLSQRVPQFRGSIAGVDRDQHDTDPRCRELQDDPLQAVASPDAEVVSLLES